MKTNEWAIREVRANNTGRKQMRAPRSDRLTTAQRFEKYVDKSGGCWLWAGFKDALGYGRFSRRSRFDDGVSPLAHRTAWELANGRPVPDGADVLHSCDVRACVNPAHLRIGTHADNMRDAKERRRNHNIHKTHCPAGHEYTSENTRIIKSYRPNGGTYRSCAACQTAKNAQRWRAAHPRVGAA